MRCHVCNVAVGDGQRFCHECGESLAGVTDPTEPLPAIDNITLEKAEQQPDRPEGDPDERLTSETVSPPSVPEVDPAPAHRGELPDLAATPTDAIDVRDERWWSDERDFRPVPDPEDMAPTEPIRTVESSPSDRTTRSLDSIPDEQDSYGARSSHETSRHSTTVMAVTDGSDADQRNGGSQAGVTSQLPAIFDGAHEVSHDTYELRDGFRLRVSFVLALLGLIAAVMVSLADVIDIRTSRPVDGIGVGLRTLDDFGTNLAVAGVIGTGLMLFGGLASCFGQRWGAGVAGGSGLATLGWAVMIIGLVEVQVDAAQQITRGSGVEVNEFVLSITRDLGWFLIVSIGALGFVVFLASLRLVGSNGRRGLNPWIAAVGALATVIVAAGPLIPLGGASPDVNLGTNMLPREFFAARLVQLGLIAAAGVLGFLSVRTYGLGLAAGGLGISVWLWVTSLAEFGDQPVGIGVGNIGGSDTVPHAVTSVGMTAALVILAVGATLALLDHRQH